LRCSRSPPLALASGWQAWAWQKDPDSTVDPAKVVTSTLLPAPDVTLGDEDTTIAGTGDTVVGPADTTDDPADPPSSGTTLFVNNHTQFDADCPSTSYTSIQTAVDASGPNDTIKVCPGTYTSSANHGHSHDGLKLESVTPLGATIQWPTVETFPLALVYFNNADHAGSCC